MDQERLILDRLVFRAARSLDLPELVALPFSAGLPGKHATRLDRQARGEVAYILALNEGRVIGHLLLKWDCPEDPYVRHLVPSCAEIEDFVVDPALTGMGIGSAMLEYATGLCRVLGESRLGLAVGKENPHAWGLYERRGFALVPGSDHRVTWLAQDRAGQQIEEGEDCVYLVKELA